jgi:ribosomal protein S18 acetylase RimI-like enzyme
MAALSDRHPEPMIELRRVMPEDLKQLLEEETADWSGGLDWDFRPSAELVRRFVHMRALTGFALMRGGRLAGYSYYVCEEGKGLVGDLYIAREYRSLDAEYALLEAVLDALWRTPGIQRVEAQLMMLSAPLTREVPHRSWFRSYPRHFLEVPLAPLAKLPAREISNMAISPWLEARHEETARLIAASYLGHVDSQINDQYRSPTGARRFLTNIVQYPGCGSFFGAASYAASDPRTGTLHGISLASLVANDVGHVTQVCVAPSHKGIGLGYELLRRSLLALAAHGCRSASLTVTVSNEAAIRLYERMGFVKLRDFAAYVWEPR